LIDAVRIFEICGVLNFEIFSKFGYTHHRLTLDSGDKMDLSGKAQEEETERNLYPEGLRKALRISRVSGGKISDDDIDPLDEETSPRKYENDDDEDEDDRRAAAKKRREDNEKRTKDDLKTTKAFWFPKSRKKGGEKKAESKKGGQSSGINRRTLTSLTSKIR
jgi:hypothetical protein